MRRTRPERGRMLDLVAEIDGAVVATGASGLNTSTMTEGAAWAFVTVDARARRQGIGDALGGKLLEHLHGLGATKATRSSVDRGGRAVGERARVVSASGRAAHRGRPAHRGGTVDTDRLPLCTDVTGCAGGRLRSGQVAASTSRRPSGTTTSGWTTSSVTGTTRTPTSSRARPSRRGRQRRRVHVPERCWRTRPARLHRHGARPPGPRARNGSEAVRATHGRERGVTRVTTSNAEQNAAMRAINRKLGFHRSASMSSSAAISSGFREVACAGVPQCILRFCDCQAVLGEGCMVHGVG